MLLAKTTHYGSSFTFFLVRPDLPQMLKCLNSFLTSGIYFLNLKPGRGCKMNVILNFFLLFTKLVENQELLIACFFT